MPTKITFLEENCWVIRSKSLNSNDFIYHVVANQWDKSPANATIYRKEIDAIRLIDDMRYYKRVGFSEKDIVEAVPLKGAILTSGTMVNLPKEGA